MTKSDTILQLYDEGNNLYYIAVHTKSDIEYVKKQIRLHRNKACTFPSKEVRDARLVDSHAIISCIKMSGMLR